MRCATSTLKPFREFKAAREAIRAKRRGTKFREVARPHGVLSA